MSTILATQARLDTLVESIRALKLPTLGPAFASLSSVQLQNSLVAYRLTKAYEVPVESANVARKAMSIDEVILRDSHGLCSFSYRELPVQSRRDFLASKEWLRGFFDGFRHTYSLRFPSGESYESSRGRNDMLQKLKGSAHWTVSPDLVDYVTEIIVRHRGLKSILRERFRRLYGERGIRALKRICKDSLGTQPRHVTFIGVKYMFRACTTMVRVSRVTTVPKDNERDRVITCESLWNMVAQLSFAQSLRSHMRLKLGFDLETRQGVHRALVRTGRATIDLRKASDCNFMVVLRDLFPPRIFRTLERMRTGIFELKEKDDGVSYHPLRMFAPMGCGCTFEVMTLTLLAHGRVLDPGATVFGDDIIVKQEVADRLICNLEAQGWMVNHDKTFTGGYFRESCGSYADLRTGFIRSYELRRPVTEEDCFLAWHKLLRLGESLPPGALRALIVNAYADACSFIPRDAFRDIDAYALAFDNPLMGWCFHVPPVVNRMAGVRLSNVHTKALALQLQRPVHYRTAMCERWDPDESRFPKQLRFFMYLHRGSSYTPHAGTSKLHNIRIEVESGSPVRVFEIINQS